ncbi:uncharacterized protein LOC117334385 [Pecten maximus]|uniref:uncharacterized protein LOC117334385 n=1 Tax=Pecten maximus TaxID=6579 RepID=UPI0014581697|nr:uncharacterized protein LOC117334385 [Pecten maximus]
MEKCSLTSVLRTLVYPTTIRIVKGDLTSEEGKHFPDKRNNVLTLYGRGLRIYVPPASNADLRLRCKDSDTSDRTRRKSADDGDGDEYTNTENLFTSNIFVSDKADLKDNHFAGKVYRNVADILSDMPVSVKANKLLFGCGDGNHIRMISEGEVLQIDRYKDGALKNILTGSVNGERVSIQLSNGSVDVTALPDPKADNTVITAGEVIHMDFYRPKEMVFEDEDIHQTYEIEVGLNVLPLNEKPLICVCCSDGYSSDRIENLDNDMLRIQNVWCLNVREDEMSGVIVQVINTDKDSSFKAVFGKHVGRDPDDFSLYNLYGKQWSPDLKPTSRRDPGVQGPPAVPRRNLLPILPPRSFARESLTLQQLPRAPPPPICIEAHIQPPSPEEIKRQLSSPTFTQSTFKEDDAFDQVKPHPHNQRLMMNESRDHCRNVDEYKAAPVPPVSSYTPLTSAVPTLNCTDDPNSTDEFKMLKLDTITIENMTISELVEMFRFYKLDHMADVCMEHMVDGMTLLELDEHDLKEKPFYLKGLALKRVLLLRQGHRPK